MRAGAEMRWVRDDVRRAQTASMVRLIAERLKVKEMGPADHIRTKHKIKAFVESGSLQTASDLLKRAQERRELNQSVTIRAAQRQSQKMAE